MAPSFKNNVTNYERIMAFPFARFAAVIKILAFDNVGYDAHGYRMFCLGFCTAAAAEAKDLDPRLRQIKTVRQLP